MEQARLSATSRLLPGGEPQREDRRQHSVPKSSWAGGIRMEPDDAPDRSKDSALFWNEPLVAPEVGAPSTPTAAEPPRRQSTQVTALPGGEVGPALSPVLKNLIERVGYWQIRQHSSLSCSAPA
jgi:hypothetical protein